MLALIPQPAHVTLLPGDLSLAPRARIAAPPTLRHEARVLAHRLTGAPVRPRRAAGTPAVELLLDPAIAHDEGYRLRITSAGITLAGATPAGVFRGIQTLSQLIHHERASASTGADTRLPCCLIEDQPRFRWRGLMMDVSRHFFSADQVCRMLDLMAMHKLNVFHWHLTDDQGWRFPVRRFPRLARVGGKRTCSLVGHERDRPRRYDDQPHEGRYTRADITRVVAHAAKLHITVVPEIDMPGHMQAAIAAYPHLGCTHDDIHVRCHWGISQHILNPSDRTVAFMQGVLDELADLFPGPFVHLGGDEALKYEWCESRDVQDRMAELGVADEAQLQTWFLQQMATFLARRGKRMIGWDEILEGGLPDQSAVMSWRGMDGGVAAAALGHDVVMTPGSHTYFDHYQAGPDDQPLAIGGMVTVEKVYGFDPLPPNMPPEHHRHVMGAQCQLWAEYIASDEHLEYMAFPRACALAEVLWSPTEARDWRGFVGRLGQHRSLLDAQGVRYGPMPAST